MLSYNEMLSFLKKYIDDGDDDSENFRVISDTLISLENYAHETFKIIDMENKNNVLSYYFSQDCSEFPEVLKEILNNNKDLYNSQIEHLSQKQTVQDEEDEL